MSNHVHVLLTQSGAGQVSPIMQALGRCYVRYVKDRYHRTGTVWEGRYKACPVDSDSYLLHCYRYIELSPVRAGMVARQGIIAGPAIAQIRRASRAPYSLPTRSTRPWIRTIQAVSRLVPAWLFRRRGFDSAATSAIARTRYRSIPEHDRSPITGAQVRQRLGVRARIGRGRRVEWKVHLGPCLASVLRIYFFSKASNSDAKESTNSRSALFLAACSKVGCK